MSDAAALTFDTKRYLVGTIDDAARLILTPEDTSTPERWMRETPYLVRLIHDTCSLNDKSLVLDYGCGIGRMARELIQQTSCRVIGVDTSSAMRAHAQLYVDSDRFVCCSPAALDWLLTCLNTTGEQLFDVALAVWVLQHCLQVQDDIARLAKHVRCGGRLFVVNNTRRAVPIIEPPYWADDGVNVIAELNQAFLYRTGGFLSHEHVSPALSDGSFWGTWSR